MGRSSRVTRETAIEVDITIDGNGLSEIDTGIGFLDHMLAIFARHGFFDLRVSCKGDLHVDYHHTVEDTGITLGLALRQAVGDKSGIRRYGFASIVHDDAWVLVSLDFSDRPFLECEADQLLGTSCPIDRELLVEFLRGFANSCGITVHVKVMRGMNGHHIVEAVFKALARACDEALKLDERLSGVLSTKGVL